MYFLIEISKSIKIPLPPIALPVNIVYFSLSKQTQHEAEMAIMFYKGFEIVAAPLQNTETES